MPVNKFKIVVLLQPNGRYISAHTVDVEVDWSKASAVEADADEDLFPASVFELDHQGAEAEERKQTEKSEEKLDSVPEMRTEAVTQ